jgi:hypothetical protein
MACETGTVLELIKKTGFIAQNGIFNAFLGYKA